MGPQRLKYGTETIICQINGIGYNQLHLDRHFGILVI
jgi:hypothetical protein